MLRAFRGTVFYNRCRQPPHVRFSLSLSPPFSLYPPPARSESCSFLVVVEENAGSQPSSCHHHRRIRFSLLSPSKSSIGKETRSKILLLPSLLPPPLPLPVYGTDGFLFVRGATRLFLVKKRKKKRKTNEKRRKRKRKGKKVNRGTRFVTKGCKVRARGRYSPRCELWFTVLATVEWKAFRRKPTADCIPYIQEAD